VSRWTFIGEPTHLKGVGIEDQRLLSRALCEALRPRYPGIRFNRVEIHAFTDQDLLEHPNPDVDLIRISFSVSGDAADLERYRFVHPSWWALIPEDRKSTMHPETKGFGDCYILQRTKNGFRVDSGSYEDGLDRICPLLMPQLLARFGRKEAQS
jgi:hypothetical protein